MLARWTVRPRLMGIPGVANVAIWGHRDRQLQVLVDPTHLRANHVSLLSVVRTAGNAQLVSPLTFLNASTPGTGGFLDGPNQRLGVRHILPFAGPSDLGQVPVEGSSAKLSDVATVVEDHPPLIGDAVAAGAAPDDALQLVVEKLPGTNTLALTRRLDDALREMGPGLAGVTINSSAFRPASFIETALDHLRLAAIIAAALVALVLAAFLMQWRAVVICLVAIPLSLLTALLVLDLTGATMNALVVAGLVVALGAVVDDAVGGVQDMARALRAERAAGSDRSTSRIVLDSAVRTRSAMGYATLIVLLLMMPVFFTGGLTGAFLHPLAVSYGLAVIASLVVALTVTPALGLVLYSRPPRGSGEHGAARRAAAATTGALTRLFRTPRPALMTLAGFVVVGLAVLPFLNAALRPTFKDRELVVHWDATPSTSLPEMHRITSRAAAEIRALPGVREVGGHVGRAITSDQVAGSGSGEMWVTMKGSADYGRTLAAIRGVVAGYPGVRSSVLTYEGDRMSGVLARGDNGLTVRTYGQDLGVLDRQAQTVRRTVAQVDGVRNARVQPVPVQPTMQIKVNLEAARRHDIKPGDVRRAAAILVQGLDVGAFFQEQKVFQVVVRGKPELRQSIDTVRNLRIDAPDGTQVRLGDVASVAVAPNPVDLRHDAVSRYVDVRAAVSGRGVDAVRADVRDRLRAMHLPLDYHAEVVTRRPASSRRCRPRWPRGSRGGRDLPAAPGRVRILAPRLARVRDASDGAGRRPGRDRRRRRRPVARGGVRPDDRPRDRRAQRGDARPAPPGAGGERVARRRARRSRDGRPCRARRTDGARHGRRAPALRGARRRRRQRDHPFDGGGRHRRARHLTVLSVFVLPALYLHLAHGAVAARAERAETAPVRDLDILPGI